jgi:hypothetical protein
MPDSFDTQWKAFLTTHGGPQKAASYSYSLWKDKYQGTGRKYGKPEEIFNEKVLIPGKIYTGLYAGFNELKENQFIDHWPVFFSMGQVIYEGKVYETGIDFNLIPPKVRVYIVKKIYEFYRKQIEKNIALIKEGKNGKHKININFKTAQRILLGTGFERSYITLLREKIGKISVIDYADWVAVIPLYTNGVRGKGINKIYENYVTNMGQTQQEKTAFINKLKK